MAEKKQPQKLELDEAEQGMLNDFLSTMQVDILNSVFIVILKKLFGNQKQFLQNIINQWSANYFDIQVKNATAAYEALTEEQKTRAIPLDRHIQIMGWCVNNVKLNWEQMLDLKNIIITN